MSTTTIHPEAGPTARTAAAAPPRRSLPVRWFAFAGGLSILACGYLIAAWAIDGPGHVGTGSTPVPTVMKVAAVVFQAGGVSGTLFCMWWFLVRPWRRERRITFDGLFVLAALTVWWQDPLMDYSGWTLTYSSALVNFGSFVPHFPGWVAPNQSKFVEPFLMTPLFYTYVMFPAMIVANLVMRRAQARWPRIGVAGLIGVSFLSIFTMDVILELGFMRFGLWSYPGSIRSLSLFGGTYYQFPLYEGVLWGAAWSSWACLRFFRNDRGDSLAERGVEQAATSDRRRTLLRFLAIAGFVNVTYLFICNLPYQLFDMNAGAWPRDVQARSYLTHGLCGPGTGWSCGGPAQPIQKHGAVHVTPDGRLAPAGR